MPNQLLELVPDAVVVVGPDGLIRQVNTAAEEMFGFSPGALVGESISMLMPATTRSAHSEQVGAFFNSPRVRKMGMGAKLKARRKDGTEFPVEIALNPISTADGPLVAAVIRDITQRVRSSEELWASEEKQRLVLETSPDVFAILDASSTIEFLSRGFHGREACALKGVALSSLLEGASPAALFDALARTRASGQLVTFQLVEAGLGGPRLRCRVRQIANAAAERFLLVLTDVTLAHETESEVLQLRDAMENAVEGILQVDLAGRIKRVNAACETMLGLSPAQLLGRPLASIFAAAERAALEAAMASCKPSGRAELESLAERAGAPAFPVRLTLVNALDLDRKEAGHYCFMRDVTEQKHAREQLLISDRMASLGMLAAGLAHEINNPLAAIVANLELAVVDLRPLLAEGEHSEELGAMLRESLESAGRVREIVRDLRIFSRHEADELGSVDLEKVIESALRLARNEIRHRARLVKVFANVPRVLAHEARLAQVLLNLLVNAAQAIPEGRAATEEIRLVTRVDHAGRAVIEVHDSGAGIPADVLPRLFTPFFTTKPVGVGTGLGLSICHRIVTGFGGEIWIDSAEGRGTTVSVALACSTDQEAVPVPPSLEVLAPIRRGRVLVIDDEAMICNAFQRILAGEHEVVTALRGANALALIREGQHFDVIICDLMMPYMTGMEVHAQLAALSPSQADRIIFLTGGAFTDSTRGFLGTVANLILDKPVDHLRLRAEVNLRVGALPTRSSSSD